MAGKKSAKSGNQEVVPAVDEDTAAVTVTDPQEQEASPGETVEESEEQETPAEEMDAAAVTDLLGQEASPGETVEESEERETPAEEMDAAAVTDLLEQEASPGETVDEPEEQDIFADDILSDGIRMKPEVLDTPAQDPAAEPEENQDAAQEKLFRITCRNKVTEMIGGVKFVDGVGYTEDAYVASWFANKDGYKVDPG